MNSIEDQVRAATRAQAGVLREVGPLRLPSAADGAPEPRSSTRARRARRWKGWMAPVTAAAAVLAIALSLALIRVIPNGPVVPASPPPSVAGVPAYYVALAGPATGATGWYGQPPATGLVVGATFTGKTLATVAPPGDLTFTGVSAAADDRTFVVTAQPTMGPTASSAEQWYLLRIAPGTADPASIARLPIGATPTATGFALSPDGSELAVALEYPEYPARSQLLRLYSVATGAVLRTWSAATGEITSAPKASGADATAAVDTSLRWTPDGRQVAFAWNGSAIRLLAVASRGTGLLTASSVRDEIWGTAYTLEGPTYHCDGTAGWFVSTDAQTVTCAASVGTLDFPMNGKENANCGKAAPLHIGFEQSIMLSGGAGELVTRPQVSTCADPAVTAEGAFLGWVSPDGSMMLGLERYPGHATFGVFVPDGRFTKLPAPPSGVPLTSVAW